MKKSNFKNNFKINNIVKTESGDITANIKIPDNSPWFDGHFPNDPILPGVAQLSMVFDILKGALNTKIQIYSFSRVRFKQIIKPSDNLDFIIIPCKTKSGQFSFQVYCKGEIVLTGVINIK